MDAMRRCLWTGAAACGGRGWSGRLEWLPFAALVLILWRLSRSRLEAFGVAAAYYGVPSFGWMDASAAFFESDADPSMDAILVWIGAAALLTLPWGLLWAKEFASSAASRLVRGTSLGLALMLPPLGLVSWCNPWVAGVAALPGLGLGGFGLVTLVVFAPGTRNWPLWFAAWLVVSAVACDRYAPSVDRGWAGMSTRYGRLSEVDLDVRYERVVSLVRAAERTGA